MKTKKLTNDSDSYLSIRLENAIQLSNGISVDTIILAPGDSCLLPTDGARDEKGDYYKVSAHSPFYVRFTVTKEGEMKIPLGSAIVNWASDTGKKMSNWYKTVTNQGSNQDLLSGKYEKNATDPKKQTEYSQLEKEWKSQMEEDFETLYDSRNLDDFTAKYEKQKQYAELTQHIYTGCTK